LEYKMVCTWVGISDRYLVDLIVESLG